MFSFGLTGFGAANKDEIDFEALTAQPDQILTNHFENDAATFPGNPSLIPTDIEFDEYNVYRIDWFDDQIQWYVNDMLIRTAIRDIPTVEMGLRLNIWVPDMFFDVAYDPALQPNTSLEDNETYLYYVDWARVSRIGVVPEPSSLALFATGIIGAFGAHTRRRRVRG